MRRHSELAAAIAALCILFGTSAVGAAEVGAVTEIRRTVYGVPPQGSQSVKRAGDAVAFQEQLETVEDSAALIRFIDDSTLAIGAKSKVLIDAFVFDPAKAEGNALINISVGTLRFVTGQMPKGKTVIKTPTATLVLRGTAVTVHVHPDGTTDTTVDEGSVDGHNDVANEDMDIDEGEGGTFGNGGNTDFNGTNPPAGPDNGGGPGDPPEHRRGSEPSPSHQEGPGGSIGPGN